MVNFDSKEFTEKLIKNQSRHARDWAIAFNATMWEKEGIRLDLITTTGWFANAMMAMHDSIMNEQKQLERNK